MIDPPAAAWHPSGSYALVLNTDDTVYRYDPVAHSLTQVASVGSAVTWRAISFAPGGAKAVLLGNTSSPVQGRIYLWDDASSQLTQMSSETFAGGTYEAIAWSHDGSTCRLLGSVSNMGTYIAYLWLFDVVAGRSGLLAHPTAAGCQDVAWATDGFDTPALAVTCGLDGASLFYLGSAGNFVDYTGNSGNVSRISARPQGDYAIAIGWSGQKVYRFQQGNWMTSFNSPTFPGIFQVAFSTDGARALILGGVFGSPAVGQVYEFRDDVYTQAGITNVSIPGFDQPPFNASTQATLNDVAWRPGCDGGLIVGGANTFTAQQAFVVRFSVTNGVPCPN
jgi:WD40 repeat protein